MNDRQIARTPPLLAEIESTSMRVGFTMASDPCVGSLLTTLAASKPGGRLLELGTGTGLSMAWLIEGMDPDSTLISVDNDPALIDIARGFFDRDKRVHLICADGSAWIKNFRGEKFDLIFADAWPGKYSELDETLALVRPGGFYIIDDMVRQPNWPEGHQEKVDALSQYLDTRKDFSVVRMNWSSGVIVCVRLSGR